MLIPLQHVALCTVLALLCAIDCSAQQPEQSTAGAQLEQLVTAEKSAVDAGDPAQILSSGSQLGFVTLELLGHLSLDQGDCGPVTDSFAQALELTATAGVSGEQHLQAQLSLITAATCANRSDVVTTATQDLLGSTGDTAQVRLLIASAHHSAGDLNGTIHELERAVAANPNSMPAHLALGNAYWELNEYQYNAETLREFTAAQRLAPDDPTTNQDLGSILSQYQRYPEAAPFLETAARLDPQSPDPWLELGMNAYAQGNMTEASRNLTKAVTLTGADRSRNNYQVRRAFAALSRIAAAQGDTEAATRHAAEEEALHAEVVRTQTSVPLTESTAVATVQPPAPSRASGLHMDSQPKSASSSPVESTLKTIVATSLNDAGTALARQRDYSGALPLFRIAAAANPEQPPLMRNLGLAAFHTGAWREAVDALTAALKQNPEDALARQDLEQARAHLESRP